MAETKALLLEEIHEMWGKDSKIDQFELHKESLLTTELHAKYMRMYTETRLNLKKLEKEQKKLYRLKHSYYSGALEKSILDSYGWKPWQKIVLKQDISMYIESDTDFQTLDLKIDYEKEKADLLKSIIGIVTNRGYQIKDAIEFLKFNSGA
jgi:Recombination, repair and ssDNA binding protein UvsY